MGSTPTPSAVRIGVCDFCKKEFRKREQKYKFCSLKCANNFNLNGLKKVVPPKKSTDLAEFVGIMLGDGELTRYQVKVSLNTLVDKEYIYYVSILMKRLFPGLEIKIRLRENEGCTTIGMNSRIVADFLKQMGITSWKPIIPIWILEQNKYIAACIRGLIDTEGCIGFKVYNGRNKNNIYRQLAFTSRNPVLLTFIRDGLSGLGLKCTQSLIKNIYLSNDKQIDQYRNLIGFHNPKLEQRSLIRDYLLYKSWRGARAV